MVKKNSRVDLETGWPDWANFRIFGQFFILDSFMKITEVAQILGYFSKGKSYVLNLTKKFGLHFWRFLSQAHLATTA
jgi:hypothetical protein